MDVWLWGATALLVGIVPCGWTALRATRADALVALEVAGTVTTLALVLLAEGFDRASYMGVPLVLAFMSLVGSLVIARFLGRHL
jgi:multisubunit Na+/H+ antiporter MnhF subunit